MMDRGTWDKHAALVQSAFSPFNGGWHFIVLMCGAQLHRDEKMVSRFSLLKTQLWRLHNDFCRDCTLVGITAFII